jgi:hypothetical protein
MRRPLSALTLSLLALAPTLSRAEEVKVTPLGEYLARFRHTEGRNFAEGGGDDFVTQRARLGAKFELGDLEAMVQLQDVRVWGEETDTVQDFSANGLDLHQGYLEGALTDDLRLRIGRQEIAYLNQRLIGTLAFVEQARSFDAVRLMATALDKKLAADLFYARVLDSVPAESKTADDLVAWAVRYSAGAFEPALIGVLDMQSSTDRVRYTQGALVDFTHPSGLKLSAEGYVQVGSATVAGVDTSFFAWMASVRARYTLKALDLAPFIEVFGEALSGDDDPTDADVKTFDTLFAANHKFYGEADFFLNIPRDTAQRGLLDTGALVGAKFADSGTVTLGYHLFRAMEAQGGDSSFGHEVDLTVGWKPNKHFGLDLNYSLFLAGDGLSAGDDPEHFVYSTVSASF